MSTLTTTSGEQQALLSMARDLARRELLPRSAELDSGDPEAMLRCWSSLVEVGLDRALLAERHGGVELGVRDLLAALEELAVGDGGIAMCVLLSNAALGRLDEPRLAEVRQGARWALVPVGDDTELTFADDRVAGVLPFVLGAGGVDGLVLLVDRIHSSTWAVHPDAATVKIEPDLTQMGLRGAPGASVKLTEAVATLIPDDLESGAAMTVENTAALLRAGAAAIARGIARRAYELALEYSEARRQGGVAIIEHEAVADMLSAMAVRLACKTQLAAGADGLHITPIAALTAKIGATDAGVATTTDAVQVFGGTGYMVETGIEKLMRDAKYCQLFPEANWLAQAELMRLVRRDAC